MQGCVRDGAQCGSSKDGNYPVADSPLFPELHTAPPAAPASNIFHFSSPTVYSDGRHSPRSGNVSVPVLPVTARPVDAKCGRQERRPATDPISGDQDVTGVALLPHRSGARQADRAMPGMPAAGPADLPATRECSACQPLSSNKHAQVINPLTLILHNRGGTRINTSGIPRSCQSGRFHWPVDKTRHYSAPERPGPVVEGRPATGTLSCP